MITIRPELAEVSKISAPLSKWYPFILYLQELDKLTNSYQLYQNVAGGEVCMQPGRLIIFWAFPDTTRRAQDLRDFMTKVYNINISFVEGLAPLKIRIYHQELSYVDYILRVDLLVPHHFPETAKFQYSPVPGDIRELIATLTKQDET